MAVYGKSVQLLPTPSPVSTHNKASGQSQASHSNQLPPALGKMVLIIIIIIIIMILHVTKVTVDYIYT